jgi:hypothetical protein
MGRAFFAPFEHSVYPILISFKQSFYGAISSISHPSGHPKPIGSAFRFHSEKHALHPAADNGMGPDFIFHGFTLLVLQTALAKTLPIGHKKD